MTEADAIKTLRRLRALERGAAAIARQFTSCAAPFEWRCMLEAIDWAVRLDRYALVQEDPLVIEIVEARLREQDEHPELRRDLALATLPELPPGARVH
jgi:hypothetical protein